jgi:transcriptional regulator with XRE-family HTH domain
MKLSTFLHIEEMSQSQLARAAGLDHSTVSRLCRDVTRPDWRAMENIARVTAFRVMPNDFLMARSAIGQKAPEVGPQATEVTVSTDDAKQGQSEANHNPPLLYASIGSNRLLPSNHTHAPVPCSDESYPVQKNLRNNHRL